MTVIFASARQDERGKYSGGKAGDQTRKEVSTQTGYIHKKGWVVLRPKTQAIADKMAYAAQAACDNNKIGYDQGQRNTLINELVRLGTYDPAKVTKKVECDCSSLVRVCCCYAGVKVGDFNTSNEASVLTATGQFKKVTFTSLAELCNGDVVVTKTKGHTCVVVSGGKGISASSSKSRKSSFPLSSSHYYGKANGSSYCHSGSNNSNDRSNIKRIQKVVDTDQDGLFGKNTDAAVRKYQKKNGLTADGKVGKNTWAKMFE